MFVTIFAIIKLIIYLSVVLTFVLTTLPLYPLISIWPYRTRKIINRIVLFYCKILLRLVNLQIDHKKSSNPLQRNALIISNHMSYMDIIVLFSLYPSSFVTSIEMKKTPFLGQLVTLGGCLFVERRSRKNLSQEISQITEALKTELNVGIFPEATSTNGDEVRKFKRPLFQGAIDANAPILPVTINYRYLNQQKVTKCNRDKVFWYGEMTFFGHLLDFFKLKKVDVEVIESDFFYPESEDDITSLSLKAHRAVTNNYIHLEECSNV